MKMVNIQEAENDLVRLVEDAANGEAFVITRDGKPLVKVEQVEPAAAEEVVGKDTRGKRQIGTLDGLYVIPDDLDTMMAKEIEEMFYGKDG